MANEKKKIVVVGAGYAGTVAAVRLAGKSRGKASITLVNPSDRFVERLRLHQQAANQKILQKPLSSILHKTGVDLVPGLVVGIRPEARSIVTRTHEGDIEMPYDNLLYATGSSIETESVPGVRTHAYRLTSSGPRSVEVLRARLVALNDTGGTVVVVGGGPTGVETAAEFAESYPKLNVSLLTRGPVTRTLGLEVQKRIIKGLIRLGVSLEQGVTVTQLKEREIVTLDGRKIAFDACVWAAGFSVSPLARIAGIATNQRGQVLTDPYMRSTSHPDIFAAGDCAWPVEEPSVPVRMAAGTAVIMGAHAADCLSAALVGRAMKPLSFAYAGQGIALGRHDAVGFNNYPADRPNAPIFTGWPAVRIREFFVRFLGNVPAYERRMPGIFIWPGKGRVAAKRRRAGTSKQPRQAL